MNAPEEKMRLRALVTKNTRLDAACCAICHEDIKPLAWCKVMYVCSHAYHIRCINEWLARRFNCPMCRAPVIYF